VSIVFDEDQEALRDTVRGFIERRSPMTQVRRAIESGESGMPVWQGLAVELGVAGLAVPEELGGAGYGRVEQAVVFEELGRALVVSPYFATVALAVNALLAAGDEGANKEYLPALVAGELTATLATTEDAGDWDAAAGTTTAVAREDRYLITGTKSFVLDGLDAGLILLTARTDDGLGLFAVDTRTTEVPRREAMQTLDLTRPMARIEFAETPARAVGTVGSAEQTVRAALDLTITALALEQVGGAQHCLDSTVEYVKIRSQFGRRIGSFQAVKHKCADMLVAVESARSAAYHAVWAAQFAPEELPVAAAMAKAVCSEAYVFCAAEAIQLHGGIGFTWEHDAHLYFRRAHASALYLGDAAHHRELLAQRLGIGR
jgi:alkylation response protein AidB-like acyl-CoA dehydrogenase